MPAELYFDHAATTPPDPRVLAEAAPYLGEAFGNPHSLHEPGRRAMAAVELARQRVAALVGAEDSMEVAFTSGATEAANWVVRAFRKVAISPFEHSAVRAPAMARGAEVLPNAGYTLGAPQREADLVCVMAVNNETGARLQAPSASCTLVDATQAVGKVPFTPGDFTILSGHKFYGLKGAGALVASGGAFPEPLLLGGEQESGLRAGTLNVPAIVALGAAAAIALDEAEADRRHADALRSAVMEELRGDWRSNDGEEQSPFILSISFRGVEGETLVLELDRQGFAISAGAACSSGSGEPSRVLEALKVEEAWRRGTIRVSFGRANTMASAQKLGQALQKSVETVINVGFVP